MSKLSVALGIIRRTREGCYEDDPRVAELSNLLFGEQESVVPDAKGPRCHDDHSGRKADCPQKVEIARGPVEKDQVPQMGAAPQPQLTKPPAESAQDNAVRNAQAILPKLLSQITGKRSYVCNSRIGGVVPYVGPVHHRSVVICPVREPVTLKKQDGTVVSNPRCLSFGFQPGTTQFNLEPQRISAVCQPAAASTRRIIQRMQGYRKSYNVATNNCQHAANEVTRGMK